jgi:hypothetical protein
MLADFRQGTIFIKEWPVHRWQDRLGISRFDRQQEWTGDTSR